MTDITDIKNKYRLFYENLERKGKLKVRDTEKGIWGTSDIENVYELFRKIDLRGKSFLDLGSGDGCVVLTAALFTDKAAGIEFDQELNDKAIEIRDSLNLKAKLIKGDFLDHDISSYDIVFINPDHEFKELDEKLAKELKGTLYVYNLVFEPNMLKKYQKIWLDQVPVTIFKKKNI